MIGLARILGNQEGLEIPVPSLPDFSLRTQSVLAFNRPMSGDLLEAIEDAHELEGNQRSGNE